MADDNGNADNGVGAELPFISHLIELRDRLLRAIIAVLAVFAMLFYFSNDIYTLLADPLLIHLKQHAGTMIATEVASPFLVPLKLTLVVSVLIAVPYLLYQLWAFVAPGLYAHEKRLIAPLLVSSTILFYAGVAFAYFVAMPMIFKFFTKVAPEGVQVMTDIGHYLDFVLTLFFAFGIAFEVPIATILLVWIGVVTPDTLVAKRPYVIVGIFIVAAILTPPDVFSQAILAVPMCLLFELGIFFSRHFVPKRDDAGDGDEDEPGADEVSMEATLDRYVADEQALSGKSSSSPEAQRPPED